MSQAWSFTPLRPSAVRRGISSSCVDESPEVASRRPFRLDVRIRIRPDVERRLHAVQDHAAIVSPQRARESLPVLGTRTPSDEVRIDWRPSAQRLKFTVAHPGHHGIPAVDERAAIGPVQRFVRHHMADFARVARPGLSPNDRPCQPHLQAGATFGPASATLRRSPRMARENPQGFGGCLRKAFP
jgi:hypothetical protein